MLLLVFLLFVQQPLSVPTPGLKNDRPKQLSVDQLHLWLVGGLSELPARRLVGIVGMVKLCSQWVSLLADWLKRNIHCQKPIKSNEDMINYADEHLLLASLFSNLHIHLRFVVFV